MNVDFIFMKMNLMKNKKYLQQKTSQKVLLHSTTCVLHVNSLLLSPHNSVGGDIVTRLFMGGWVSE